MMRSTMRLCCPILLAILTLSGCWLNSVEDQARKLGQRKFTPAAWGSASQVERAEMTASFLDQYDTKNFTRKDIEALLGTQTGYYDYDSNIVYVVGPDTVKNMYGKGYLLIFEANKNNGKIDKVFFDPEVQ
ncbi:hypothetical protein [Massilia arenae]|uniref:DUF3887 domain-containing protein n=1 Tax=Massilia arenae TaxID=2603288 RepID=A0A5C7G0V1_9BURK|nr:hypothetical protein [Massilia arenae]TXF99068.1 hypothetical protein FVD38_14835 [Massilia arenae]